MRIKCQPAQRYPLIEQYPGSCAKRVRFTIRRLSAKQSEAKPYQSDHRYFYRAAVLRNSSLQDNTSCDKEPLPFGDYGETKSGENQTPQEATDLEYPDWNASSSENPFEQEPFCETISFSESNTSQQSVNPTINMKEFERKKLKLHTRWYEQVGGNMRRTKGLGDASNIIWGDELGKGRLFVDYLDTIILTSVPKMRALQPNSPSLLIRRNKRNRSKGLPQCLEQCREGEQVKQKQASELKQVKHRSYTDGSGRNMDRSIAPPRFGKIFRLLRATPIRYLPGVLYSHPLAYRTTKIRPCQLESNHVIVDCLQQRPCYTAELVYLHWKNNFPLEFGSRLFDGKLSSMLTFCTRSEIVHRAHANIEFVHTQSVVSKFCEEYLLESIFIKHYDTLVLKISLCCQCNSSSAANLIPKFNHKNPSSIKAYVKSGFLVQKAFCEVIEAASEFRLQRRLLQCINYDQSPCINRVPVHSIMFKCLAHFIAVERYPAWKELELSGPPRMINLAGISIIWKYEICCYEVCTVALILNRARFIDMYLHSVQKLSSQNGVTSGSSITSGKKSLIQCTAESVVIYMPKMMTDTTETSKLDLIKPLLSSISYDQSFEHVLFVDIVYHSSLTRLSPVISSSYGCVASFMTAHDFGKLQHFRLRVSADKDQQLCSNYSAGDPSDMLWLRWFRQCAVTTLSAVTMRCGTFGLHLCDLLPLTGVCLALIVCGLLCYGKTFRVR